MSSPDISALATQLPPEIKESFSNAQQVVVPAGTLLFHENQQCQSFTWLLEGTIRVFKHSPEGREITLYRVNPGEICILSVQSLLCGEGFPAEAIAETDLLGLQLNHNAFNQALDDSNQFHRYLLKILSRRISYTMQLISQVTFQHLDLRLACHLQEMFEQSAGEPIKTTHAQIAQELGTTREMISRILKELEHMGCIKLSRGAIELVSIEDLKLAGQPPDLKK